MQENSRNIEAVRVIESLRAGIPTRSSTRQLPDLRAELTSLVDQDLSEFKEGKIPQGRLIWGQYGQGKTHVLTTVEHLALAKGFAVSLVSLSREVSCHNFQHFYSKVASRIRVPDSNVYGIYKALSRKYSSDLSDSEIQKEGRYIHPLPALVAETFFYAAAGEEQDLIFSDLMGTKLPIAEIKRIYKTNRHTSFPKFQEPFKITEHMKAYFGVMADLIKFCGYSGWVILVDEAELIGRLGKIGRLKAYMNLSWLLNVRGMQQYPIYCVVASASRLQNELWFSDGRNDMVEIPYAARERIGNDAADELTYFFSWAISQHNPSVAPVIRERLEGLLKRVAELHGITYGWDSEIDVNQLLKSLGDTTIRNYIRAALEILDQKYIYRDYEMPVVDLTPETALEEDESFFEAVNQNEETISEVDAL